MLGVIFHPYGQKTACLGAIFCPYRRK